ATQTGDNNYRHPEYQLPFTQTSKTKFKRSYDLYSLGVVLIEIGLWKQIDSFRPEGSHALAFKRHLEERVAPTLKFYMGEKYTLAVLNCLDTSRIAPDGDEDWRLSDAFSRKWKPHMWNLFVPELGHVICLRHEFAIGDVRDEMTADREGEGAVRLGAPDPMSAMNYLNEPPQLQYSDID
ncbi:hypothetical protein FPANT_13903, partial [Fusarium pseudoanthophilum]